MMIHVANELLTLHANVRAGHFIPLDVPQPGPATCPTGTCAKVGTALGWLQWVGYGACIAALIVAAIRLGFGGRGGDGGEHAGRVGMALIAVIIIGAAAGLVGTFA